MDDQLDNDLKNRIREVFDNYEDTTADEGWLLLREKFPVEEKKRPLVWLWWASAAAGLLLFLSIGMWMLDKKPVTNNVAIQPVKQQIKTTKATSVDSATQLAANPGPTAKNTPVDTVVSTQQSMAKNTLPATKKHQHGTSLVDTALTIQNTIAQNNGPAIKKPVNNNSLVNAAAITSNVIAQNNKPGKPAVNTPVTGQKSNTSNITLGGNNNPVIAQQPVNKQPAISAASAVKGGDTVKAIIPKNNNPQYAANTPVTSATNTTNTVKPNNTNQPAASVKSANAMATMFANDNFHDTKKDKVIDDKKVKFGIYAATFFNYAKGSANQVNAGAGFSSDIRLGKNFKLTTGVALAQNTLKYNSNTPPTQNAVSAVSYALAAQDTKLVPASSFPVFKNYNASLVGLDVPINIKYEFNPQKTDAYFSAGLSSGTFINEAYTTSYGSPNSSLLAGSTQQTSEETNRQSFNSFYFAKTLNISFGIGTALGKSNRLVIEPFLKYPLEGLGSQQIKFGAGGINLKLNFTKLKK
ncbi:outer membrane beta-barrel protein [Mucilaginibacter sp. FT3.2]|uniref:outer membrane beta-barrel protein n=1 Tax=Mucilaginibacter sp. FT3.2 TaxID=2723090 RepID=UPI0016094B03|nr:outer membrane beta-barrel protein [Mucilaginibacter sp. FT3.2]MBB6231999.1 hypothetical protein [Mucilaginibacter sp. FT3.2]